MKQLWKTAYSCAVDVLTFSILGNHFHILLRLPAEIKMDDMELLKRYRVLYPKPNKYQAKGIEDYERELAMGGETAEAARGELLERMGDLPKFMQLLKQRFSIWYNHSRGRKGTLWRESYKSVLVENRAESLKIVAAYIDLNAVRAGLVSDPKDYRFCGYGQWVGGAAQASEGFRKLFQFDDENWTMSNYRQILYGKGVEAKADGSGGGVLDVDAAREVFARGGELSVSERLLCRGRYFREGWILGSRQFISEAFPELKRMGATKRKSERAFPIPGFEETGLAGFRQLRNKDV